jgi:EAL and modified HD-GYP domain-containing signal transduction protein
VTSIQDAFMLVGEYRFRALVSVAASGLLSQGQPPALISLSLQRARFCELLASLIGELPSEQFMVGQLSLLDAILETPMATIVKTLPLRPEAKSALMGAKNRIAAPLTLIRAFETGAWATCGGTAKELGLAEDKLTELYVESVKWATEVLAANK